MEPNELKKIPFYSWNCLTLCLPQKDVDLVIKDELDMERLMKFLVYHLKTVDGQAGTAIPVLKKMNRKMEREYLQRNNCKRLPTVKLQEINIANEYEINQQVMMRYKIMKMRAKISFSAL